MSDALSGSATSLDWRTAFGDAEAAATENASAFLLGVAQLEFGLRLGRSPEAAAHAERAAGLSASVRAACAGWAALDAELGGDGGAAQRWRREATRALLMERLRGAALAAAAAVDASALAAGREEAASAASAARAAAAAGAAASPSPSARAGGSPARQHELAFGSGGGSGSGAELDVLSGRWRPNSSSSRQQVRYGAAAGAALLSKQQAASRTAMPRQAARAPPTSAVREPAVGIQIGVGFRRGRPQPRGQPSAATGR